MRAVFADRLELQPVSVEYAGEGTVNGVVCVNGRYYQISGVPAFSPVPPEESLLATPGTAGRRKIVELRKCISVFPSPLSVLINDLLKHQEVQFKDVRKHYLKLARIKDAPENNVDLFHADRALADTWRNIFYVLTGVAHS